MRKIKTILNALKQAQDKQTADALFCELEKSILFETREQQDQFKETYKNEPFIHFEKFVNNNFYNVEKAISKKKFYVCDALSKATMNLIDAFVRLDHCDFAADENYKVFYIKMQNICESHSINLIMKECNFLKDNINMIKDQEKADKIKNLLYLVILSVF